MTTWVDITVALRDGMPSWPGSPGFTRTTQDRIEDGDRILDSTLVMDTHSGTHVDAPAHFLADGPTVDHLDLDPFLGPAQVLTINDVDVVTAAALDAAAGKDGVAPRLLIRTRNARRWPADDAFDTAFVGLDESAAQWCVDRGVRLVGIDYLSIQSPTAGPETHRILLRAGVVILEGIDLTDATDGDWELLCLPMRIADGEGAPARAILRRPDDRRPANTDRQDTP